MKLAYTVAVGLVAMLGAVVGCEDDRAIGDLGAGGVPGNGKGGAVGVAGSPDANGGSESTPGGQPNGGMSAGGVGGADSSECPTDFFEADGTPCSTEGQLCSDGADDPCGFGNSLICFGGEWQRQEAFPSPCGGAGSGGAGGADAGGAGGAGGNQ